ncbi:membrane-spanning 4-domains subfamily A member 4A-like [Epinephelus fuscoguttatus]|uniref:membrane-spanning 4-domains subfamily A member 4A-like n=1 Tax=Epinephelus fuscoguttatus TaxID=293821 RepID=UPI0020D0810A|nr:membrane-spanning 4-domains subfamily A member 4A-like [Epinephelus fuscoguttatus]
MSAFSSTATAVDSVVVVTHVHRTIQPVLPRHSPAPGQHLNPGNNYSLSGGQLQVVGLVQMAIGKIILVCGCIIFATSHDKLSVYSGVFAWGSLLFIIAGSVTVSAGMSMSQSRMKSAVCYNVATTVTAIPIGIIFFLDTAEILKTNDNDHPPWFPDHDEVKCFDLMLH